MIQDKTNLILDMFYRKEICNDCPPIDFLLIMSRMKTLKEI